MDDENEPESPEVAGDSEQHDETVREAAEQVNLAAQDAERKGMNGVARSERALAGDFSFLKTIATLQQRMTPSLASYYAAQRQLAKMTAPALDVGRAANALAPMKQALDAQQAEFDRLGEAVRKLLEPHQELTQQINQRVVDAYALLRLAPGFGEPGTWLTALGSHRPRNWRGLAWDDQKTATVSSILAQDGIPLAWVPRASIVTELIASDESGRRDLLAQRGDEIAQDCSGVLEETHAPRLAPLVALLREALKGLTVSAAASQALAANIFDTFLRDANRRGAMFEVRVKEYGFYADYKKKVAPVSNETTAREYRVACVLTPTIPALATYNDGDCVPTRYRRHATAHRADPVQYTRANAITALMLATSLLREAQESDW